MTESVAYATGSGGPAKPVRRLTYRPIEMKRWIVEQTFVAGASVAQVARKHGVNANQVFDWRKRYREGTLVSRRKASKAAPPPVHSEDVTGQSLVRVGVIEHEVPASAHCVALPALPAAAAVVEAARPGSDLVEIELPGGIRLRVSPDGLRSVLATVKELA